MNTTDAAPTDAVGRSLVPAAAAAGRREAISGVASAPRRGVRALLAGAIVIVVAGACALSEGDGRPLGHILLPVTARILGGLHDRLLVVTHDIEAVPSAGWWRVER